MADHENAALLFCQLGERLGLTHIERQRLLDERVLPGLEGQPRQRGMLRSWSRYDHGIDPWVTESLIETQRWDAVLVTDRFGNVSVGIVDSFQHTETVERSD
jgi:hypothetical protein